MGEFFVWGESLLSGLEEVGEWLMSKPLAAYDPYFRFLSDVFEFYQFEINGYEFGVSDSVVRFFDILGTQSIGSLLLGGAITIVLSIKVIQFIMDIFP